jgi:signal transduction histidine kinase
MIDMIIQTEDRERQRFARDLHDEIGPYLSGLKLYLNELGNLEKEPKKRQMAIHYMIEVIDEAILRIREIANNMLPAQIIQFGIVGSIQNIIEKISQSKLISISLQYSGNEPAIEQTYAFSIYRIIIELIANTLKHANAKNIGIVFSFQPEVLRLNYRDDGRGFYIDDEIKANKGIGLQSIINRTQMFNGTYLFKSAENKGIDFEFQFPVT